MTPDPLRVAGRYEIHRLLGRGGMASVHLARQPALNREVALKELHSRHLIDAALAHRFLHESRVAGALTHPSIVAVIEYFEHEGVPFIAMEYLERGSLRPFVGRLTLAQVGRVLESVLGGLAEAASRGIVHRDLKPENVLVTADGHAKVTDFGIAKALGQVCLTEFRTATGQIIGTPAYMAPEQATGGEITPQVDLYATGLIAYELLAGRHPFHDCDAPMALLMRHVNGELPPLADVRPDLPPAVVDWVHAMLAKQPDARPAGAARAWDRLDGVLCDTLGPRWRRAGALEEPDAPPAHVVGVEPCPSSELSGFASVVLPPVRELPSVVGEPVQVKPSAPMPEPLQTEPTVAVPGPAQTDATAVLPGPARTDATAVLPGPARTEPTAALHEPAWTEPAAAPGRDDGQDGPRPRPRRRALALAVPATAVLLLAIAVTTLPSAPGEVPRAALPRPAGPSLVERLRDVVTPAVRANTRLSDELSSLEIGTKPVDALDRVEAALPATDRALAAVRESDAGAADERLLRARADRALTTQARYLEVVRATLTGDPRLNTLGSLSAQLISRLERIEALIPRASESVRGARRLAWWATAQIAATPAPLTAQPAAPAPHAPPTATATATATTTPTPHATATPTPTPSATPTATPTPSADDGTHEGARRFHPRRARLRERLKQQTALGEL